MAQPYIKDGAITYDEFEKIFSFLSRREQYDVTELLFKNGINLVDDHIEDALALDVENWEDTDNSLDDDFEILYNDALFKDSDYCNAKSDELVINRVIQQSNEILCRLIQDGNQQAKQDLCVKNKRLIDKYVCAYEKRYGNHLDYEDLEQAGFLGLIKAAQRFDTQQETAFSTYAVFWIKQCISREIMENGYAIRIPVHMMERINRVISVDNHLAESGMSLRERISYAAVELGLTEANIRECLLLKANYLSYCSLDTPIGEDGDSELGEFVVDETSENIEQIVMTNSLREEIERILNTITPKERQVIELRFGLKDGRSRTLEEIGTIFGVTRERIRQIEAKALRKLKHTSRAKLIRDYLEEK